MYTSWHRRRAGLRRRSRKAARSDNALHLPRPAAGGGERRALGALHVPRLPRGVDLGSGAGCPHRAAGPRPAARNEAPARTAGRGVAVGMSGGGTNRPDVLGVRLSEIPERDSLRGVPKRAARRRARQRADADGICRECLARPRRPDRVLCIACAGSHAKSDKRRYNKVMACPDRLKAKRSAFSEWRKRRRAAAVAAGLCGTCRRVPCGRFKDCLACRTRRSAYKQAAKARNTAACPLSAGWCPAIAVGGQ